MIEPAEPGGGGIPKAALVLIASATEVAWVVCDDRVRGALCDPPGPPEFPLAPPPGPDPFPLPPPLLDDDDEFILFIDMAMYMAERAMM